MRIFGKKCIASGTSGMKKNKQFTNQNDRFDTKSTWSPKKGHPVLELFHSNVEKNLFPSSW